MTQHRVHDWNSLMIKLFELLRKSPDGVDIHQIGDELGYDSQTERGYLFEVIRRLRLLLGSATDDRLSGFSIPIRVERNGTRAGRHVYFLTANAEDGVDWQATRAQTMISRLEVDKAHWKVMVDATDGRTTEGRIARAALLHYTRLEEDIRLIREGYGLQS